MQVLLVTLSLTSTGTTHRSVCQEMRTAIALLTRDNRLATGNGTVTPTNDLRESMILLSYLPKVTPINDLGESMLLLSSLAAPSSKRGESIAVATLLFFVSGDRINVYNSHVQH